LAVLFSIVALRKIIAETWREVRTVIIHKGGPRSDPRNWKPITIGSAVQELFHKILAAKPRKNIELHPSQKGFLDVDGTLFNSITLDNYISSRAKTGKSYNVVALDVSKAFDSVAHSILRTALRGLGIDEDTHEYISDTFQARITITVAKEKTVPY
jgi:hypothetical protein